METPIDITHTSVTLYQYKNTMTWNNPKSIKYNHLNIGNISTTLIIIFLEHLFFFLMNI